MTVNQNLVNKLRQELPDILDATPVTLAYLYGSVVTGDVLPTSDVDIALVLCRHGDSPEMSAKARMQLEFFVEDSLAQVGVPNPDAKVIDEMPLVFRGEVATRGVRLYSKDEEARVEFETYTWKAYLDYKPVAEMMSRAFVSNVKKYGLGKR